MAPGWRASTAALPHLLKHLQQQRCLFGWSLRLVRELDTGVTGELVTRDSMLLTLHRNLRQVHRHRVVHLVVLEVLSDHQCDQLRVLILLNLLRDRVLPLEAGLLLRVRIRVALDRLEDLGAELRAKRAKRALLL